MRIPFAILIAFLFTLPGLAQDATWQTVEVQRELSRSISRESLELELLAEARTLLVEKVAGVGVRKVESLATSERMEAKAGGPKSTTDWYEDYMYYTRQETAGRIVEERKPQFTVNDAGRVSQLSLKLEALVAIDGDPSDPAFDATLRTNQPTYRANDPFRVEARSTRDAALYLFSVTAKGECTLIWPNSVEPDSRLSANESLAIPRNPEKVSFVALLPDETIGNNSARDVQEMLFGIFYRGSDVLFDPAMAFVNTWTLAELNRIILRIPRKERAEVMEVYRIVER